MKKKKKKKLIQNQRGLNNSKNYIGELIFSVQFPEGKRLKISNGKIIDKEDDSFLYNLRTDKGSSGSPILLIDNAELIGLNQSKYKTKKNINFGIPFNLIINSISYIKPIYYIPIFGSSQKGQSTILNGLMSAKILNSINSNSNFICLFKNSKNIKFYHVNLKKEEIIIFEKDGEEITGEENIIKKLKK